LCAKKNKDTKKEEVSEPEPFILRKIVTSAWFDVFFSFLILCNVVIMTLDAQLPGMGIGNDLAVDGYPTTGEEAWSGAPIVFETIELVLSIMVCVEICLKFIAMSKTFFCSGWNVFDGLVVLLWLAAISGGNVLLDCANLGATGPHSEDEEFVAKSGFIRRLSYPKRRIPKSV